MFRLIRLPRHRSLHRHARHSRHARRQDHLINDIAHNAFLIAALCDLKAIEAAPLIEQTYVSDHVDISYCGDWEDAQIRLGLREKRSMPEPDYFKGFGRKSKNESARDSDFSPLFDPPMRNTASKISRNDPCPCGSGKKYKKCCLDKAN